MPADRYVHVLGTRGLYGQTDRLRAAALLACSRKSPRLAAAYPGLAGPLQVDRVEVAVTPNQTVLPLHRPLVAPAHTLDGERRRAWRHFQQLSWTPVAHDRPQHLPRAGDRDARATFEQIEDRLSLEAVSR